MLKVMYFRKVVVVVEFRRLFILLLFGKKISIYSFRHFQNPFSSRPKNNSSDFFSSCEIEMVFRRRCFFLFLFIKHSFFFVSSQYFSMIFGATLSSISWEGDFFLFVFRVYFFDHQKMRFQGNSIKAILISSYFLVKTKGPKKKKFKEKKGSNQWWYFTKTKTSAWIFLCGERVVFLEIRILLSSGSSRRVVLLKSFLFIIFHNYNRKKRRDVL